MAKRKIENSIYDLIKVVEQAAVDKLQQIVRSLGTGADAQEQFGSTNLVIPGLVLTYLIIVDLIIRAGNRSSGAIGANIRERIPDVRFGISEEIKRVDSDFSKGTLWRKIQRATAFGDISGTQWASLLLPAGVSLKIAYISFGYTANWVDESGTQFACGDLESVREFERLTDLMAVAIAPRGIDGQQPNEAAAPVAPARKSKRKPHDD